MITYYEYPTSLRGSAFQANTRINDPQLTAKYKSFEIAASRRFSQRWQAMASYSRTWINAPGAECHRQSEQPNLHPQPVDMNGAPRRLAPTR